MRLDKYLKVSRIIKRRTVANEVCDAKHVTVNGKIARASYEVKEGDLIEIQMGENLTKYKVISINEYAKTIMTSDILTPKLTIDALVSPEDISCSTAEDLSILEPFGIGNKTPVFCVENTLVSSVRTHKSGKHIFMTLEKGKKYFDAPAFNMGQELGDIIPGERISVAGMVNINTFRGIDNVQFVVRDYKECDRGCINEESLRCIFKFIKNFVTRNIFRIKLSELKEKINNEGHNLGITKIKTALNIFKELELITSTIENDTLSVTRGKNFYSKCNLTDSKIYNDEIEKNEHSKEEDL